MFVYRISDVARRPPSLNGEGFRAFAAVGGEKIVIFSDTLTVDSHGQCVQIHDKNVQQSKYVFYGEPPCETCEYCRRLPLITDTIIVKDQRTKIEIKSRHLSMTEDGAAYCQSHCIKLIDMT